MVSNNMDNISHRAVIRYLGLEGPREIHEDMVVKLGENAPSYSMVKATPVRGQSPSPQRKEVFYLFNNALNTFYLRLYGVGTTNETISKIHDIIMADRRVTENYIASELGISQENQADSAWKVDNRSVFCQNNAPAHMSTVAMAAIQKCGFQHVEDPPYPPDSAPSATTSSRK